MYYDTTYPLNEDEKMLADIKEVLRKNFLYIGSPLESVTSLIARQANLLSRVRCLEEAIRTHRSQKADDRCIEDDDRLYEALGDGVKCDRRVGSKEDMLENCKRFIKNRCEQGGWPTYAKLEKENEELQDIIISLLGQRCLSKDQDA
jgi:hypothetical protein